MAFPADSPQIDLTDLVQRRVFYESQRTAMAGERSTWDPVYNQLAAFVLPRSQQPIGGQANAGQRQDFAIINETATLCLRVLASGMLTGMSGPTRSWFRFRTEDDDLNDQPDVRQWCEAVEDLLRRAMLRSNFYQTLLGFYREQGLYGTSAFLIEKDSEPDPRKNTVFRCRPFPIGSYYLATDAQLRPDFAMRVVKMKVRDVVQMFGYENVSKSTQVMSDSPGGGVKDTWRQVVHVIHRAEYFGEQARHIIKSPWVSAFYELDTYDPSNAILRTDPYWENPLVVGRWDVVGENVYGESPTMDVLGSIMALQTYEASQAQGTERMVDPAMVYSTKALDARKLSTLPGEMLGADADDVSKIIHPAFQMDFSRGVQTVQEKIRAIEDRISRGMYRDVFQAVTNLEGDQRTAAEIHARQAEQMQVLGPIVERNVEEGLAPAVTRIFAIMYRAGRIPPLPKAMHGQPLRIQFESILAQAQRLEKVTSILNWATFVGQEVAVNQGSMDNIDIDASVREVGELYAVPNNLLRTPEQVQKIRADRAYQQQQAARAEQAQQLAQAGANLSKASTSDGGNLLDKLAPALTGGTP